MGDWGKRLGADKAESNVLVLFIPSVDRDDQPIDQAHWEKEALETLGGYSEEPRRSLRAAASGEMTSEVDGSSTMPR